MVKVLDGCGDIIAMVKYNQNLDYWDGRNYSCGSVGRHLGITKLKDGRFVLIHTSDWQGEIDSAEVVTDEEALQAIIRTCSTNILKEKKYEPLKKLYEEKYLNQEVEDED